MFSWPGQYLRTARAEHHPTPVQEFLRVGYYTQTDYKDEALRDNPPDTPDIDKCALTHRPPATIYHLFIFILQSRARHKACALAFAREL